jgi:pimeloyl-ACP methyl ester carboxylesterase
MHGLGGTKDEKQIVEVTHTLYDAGFTVLRFDATNTFGESDGSYEQATLTKHCSDLEDVMAWAAQQPWYKPPVVLVGHSFGGHAVARFAELHPDQVQLLMPLSPLVSGKLSEEAHTAYDPNYITNWRESGWREDRSVTHPDRIRRLPWSHMIDRYTHDLLPDAYKLTMPTLVVVGEEDRVTPVAQVKKFYDAVPGPKEFVVVPKTAHVFRDEASLAVLTTTVRAFVEAQS